MEQLLYTSTANAGLAADELFKIVTVSARNNPARAVTGFLVFADGAFLQLIEGDRSDLDELLGILARDPRHRGIAVKARRPIDSRSFPSWRMQRIDTSGRDVQVALAPLRSAGLKGEMLEQVEEFVRAAA